MRTVDVKKVKALFDCLMVLSICWSAWDVYKAIRHYKLQTKYDELYDRFIDYIQDDLESDIAHWELVETLLDELEKDDDRELSQKEIEELKKIAHKKKIHCYADLRKTV